MTGHLFVVQGDLLGVACDAVLIPSGTGADGAGVTRPGRVTSGWLADLGGAVQNGFLVDAPDAERPVVMVVEPDDIRRPAVWAGFTGDRGDEPLDFHTRVVDGFIRGAGAHARVSSCSGSRPLMSERPVVALPLIGGGEGGRRDDRGGLLKGVVEAIVGAVAREDVDAILVLNDETAYAAAQQARSRIDHNELWGELTDEHEREALRISGLARDGRLVVFLGAGASIGAGLPSWSDLLAKLAARADLDEHQREELGHLEHRDAGRILDQRLKKHGGLAAAVAEETAAERCSLLHQLVASPPIRKAVTTNYDTLFECAWQAVDEQRPRVLPWDAAADERRWLLKLHGCVDHPASIVLSRDDYLRFEAEGVALAGIVQAMLLTRHMLFVGYSLSDDNFHRLVHQVRAAIGSADRPADAMFGTVLTPRAPSLGDDLWRGSVLFVSTADTDGGDDPRRTAILLDRIGALAAAPAAHVLVDSYAALFSESQIELGKTLSAVWELVESGALDRATEDAVKDALGRIGRPGRA